MKGVQKPKWKFRAIHHDRGLGIRAHANRAHASGCSHRPDHAYAGGLALAAEMIAMALKDHTAKVTAIVPFYAMSGGTLIALAADEILMERFTTLGSVDPQIMGYPAAVLLRVLTQKPIAAVSDEMIVKAEVARLACRPRTGLCSGCWKVGCLRSRRPHSPVFSLEGTSRTIRRSHLRLSLGLGSMSRKVCLHSSTTSSPRVNSGCANARVSQVTTRAVSVSRGDSGF